MSKFKAGDKVRVIDDSCVRPTLHAGDIFTVSDHVGARVALAGIDGRWNEYRFELVPPEPVPFTPPGEGWIEGNVKGSEYEVHAYWPGGDESPRFWYRPLPKPPVVLPHEAQTVIRVRWKKGTAFWGTNWRFNGIDWVNIDGKRLSTADLTDRIESFDVLSRPVKNTVEEFVAKVQDRVNRGGTGWLAAVREIAREYGVKP